jgi:hypothetical protein
MREIPLSRGKVAIVDDADYEWLSQWKWSVGGSRQGHARRGVIKNGRWTSSLMHREIMDAAPEQQVDHINGDRFDNRRCNLRLCNGTENNRNRPKRKDSTAPYKGIVWCGGRWWARINLDGKQTFLSSHATAEAAARAYNEAALAVYGDFARVNRI